MAAIALALGASLAWGASDFVAGLKSRQLAVIAALAFGMFFVGIDHAADDGALWAVTLTRAAPVTVLVAAVLVLRPAPLGRAAVAPLAGIGALDTGANVMFAAALTVGAASI